MITRSNDIPAIQVDTKSLATLIIELNIARRNCRAYPKGHPFIAASIAKVLQVYESLLNKHTELILGVTSDALMIDGIILEKSNLVYRDFSRALFERGIGALLLHPGLTADELNNFALILGLKREQIHQRGGIEQVWAEAGMVSLSILPIRYDLFQSTDENAVTASRTIDSGDGLWDKFARELTHGTLPSGIGSVTYLDPEILARPLISNLPAAASRNQNFAPLLPIFFHLLISVHPPRRSPTKPTKSWPYLSVISTPNCAGNSLTAPSVTKATTSIPLQNKFSPNFPTLRYLKHLKI